MSNEPSTEELCAFADSERARLQRYARRARWIAVFCLVCAAFNVAMTFVGGIPWISAASATVSGYCGGSMMRSSHCWQQLSDKMALVADELRFVSRDSTQ